MLLLNKASELLETRLIDVRHEDPTNEGRHRAAVAIVLREAETAVEDVELLLIKRAEDPRDTWSGHMALPGGRWEPGDTSLVDTAVRETCEEVGIDLGEGRVLGRLPRLSPRSPRLPPIDITPYVALAPPGATVHNSAEVAASFWVSLELLVRTGTSARYSLEMAGERREWPAYPFREHLIWGLTERILSTFISLLQSEKEF